MQLPNRIIRVLPMLEWAGSRSSLSSAKFTPYLPFTRMRLFDEQ
jgi:hypothetical protein